MGRAQRTDVPREIFALAAVAFCVALGFGVLAPAIPLFAKEFGVGATAAGAVVSAFALMRLVFGPFSGKLVDRLGERVTLVGGLAVVALSSLLAGLSQTYPQLIVLRAVGGIGSTVFTVAAMALVIRVTGAHARGRAMSVYQSGFVIGGIVGPAAGGAVLGLSLRAPFFFYAATLALAGVVGLLFLAKLPPNGHRRRSGDQNGDQPTDESAGQSADRHGDQSADEVQPDLRLAEALRLPGYRAALATNLAIGLTLFGLRGSLTPLLVVDEVGAEPSWVAWTFFVSGVVQTALMFPAGKLVDSIGRRTPMLVGVAATAVGLAMLGVSGSLGMVFAAMTIMGVGAAFLGPVPGALIGDVVRGRGGTLVAVSQMLSDAGAVVGPLLAGALAEYVSFEAAFGFGALVVLAVGWFALKLPKRAPVATHS